MNTVLIILIIVGVVVLGWKWLDTRAKVAASPGYGKRMGVFYLLSAFTILVGITTVFADALFELLGLNKPAHFELMAFVAFGIFCAAAVLILRDKGEPSLNTTNRDVNVGRDAGVVVNKPKSPVNFGTGMDKKKALTKAEPRNFSGTNQGVNVQGDAGIVVAGDNATIINQAQKKYPKWLKNYPRFDEKLIGRAQDLQQLAEMIETSKNVVLVNGMGGIGKTTLAIAYLDQYKDQYDHIVWLEQLGDFPETLLSNELLLENLGVISVSGEPDKDVYRILNQLGNIGGSCLLVIDNADERLQAHRAHLPRDWRVLITSRQELGFSATFNLAFLDEASALELFYVHCEHVRDEALVQEIIKAVGFHTLTIELLAKTAARKKLTLPLDELWRNIQERGLRLGKAINIATTHSRNEKIEKIFPYLCSIFELQDLPEKESWLLKQFVCLPPTFHTFDELKSLLQCTEEDEIEALENGLLRLKEKGWLFADQKVDAYKMHRIIMDVVAAQLDIKEQDIAALRDTLIEVTAYHYNRNPIEQFPWISYGKQLLTIISSGLSDKIGNLYNNIGLLYKVQGRYKESLTFYQKAIKIREAVLDPQNSDLATSYNNIATLYQAQGRYEEALTFNQKAIEIREAVLYPQHPDLASSYNNIAELYRVQGRYEEALTSYQKAIEIWEAVLDPQHPHLATSYSNIGLLYQDQDRYEEAWTFYQKAIEIREAVLDPQHPDLATSYNNIAELYRVQGRYEEALTFNQKTIEIFEAVLDPQHPNLAASYNNIGLLYKVQGRYEEALTFFQKDIEISEAVLDSQHPDLASSYNNIGRLYQAQSRYKEALTFYEKAIEILQQSLGDQHPTTQKVIRNLEILKNEMDEQEG